MDFTIITTLLKEYKLRYSRYNVKTLTSMDANYLLSGEVMCRANEKGYGIMP